MLTFCRLLVLGGVPSDTTSQAAALAVAQALGSTCSQPSNGDPVRHFIALGATAEARACLVSQLSRKSGRGNAAAWALAAATVPDYASTFANHARHLLKGKEAQRYPSSYDVIGPLPIGKNEVDGDPLETHSGAFVHWLRRPEGGSVASELGMGGRVSWRSVRPEPGPQGVLRIAWPETPWGNLVQALGQRAVLEVQAWAVGTVAVAVEGEYKLDCRGVHKVHLHSAVAAHRQPLVINGDLYGSGAHGGGGFGVGRLAVGAYVLAMRVRAVAQAAPSCQLTPVRPGQAWSLSPPMQMPDLILPQAARQGSVDGLPARLCGGYTSIGVRNHGSDWLRGVAVRSRDAAVTVTTVDMVREAPGGEAPGVPGSQSIDVAPGQLRLVALRLTLAAGAKFSCPFAVDVEVSARRDGGLKANTPAALSSTLKLGGGQCRRPDQSVICTHLDHDGAVSAAAVLAPRDRDACCPTYGCPAILSLHGTSIPVRDSADAYKHKPADAPPTAGYTFGAERYWVVAPTRHGAHNWEGGGRMSAMSALDSLARMARDGLLPSTAPIDSQRVLYTGHSMVRHPMCPLLPCTFHSRWPEAPLTEIGARRAATARGLRPCRGLIERSASSLSPAR